MSVWRRPDLPPGIYDEIVTERVRRLLDRLPAGLRAEVEALPATADVAPPLVALLREAIDAAFDEAEGTPASLELAAALLSVLRSHAPRSFGQEADWTLLPQRLRAVAALPATAPRPPVGPLHRCSLIANAEGDRLVDHLRSEFASADSVDLLCAFVKLSGVEKLRSALEHHCSTRGRPLRVLTTTYMGASDQKAIERLAALPNVELRVSYDVDSTRLHAKAWVFHRASGLSTAYVGSSNLSHAAQTEGLEWNVRVTESADPALVAQLGETFEQYWQDAHLFERFDPATDGARLARALGRSAVQTDGAAWLPEIEPRSHQKPVLDELERARALGRHRNLLVAATGTGKTIMAALDYARLRHARKVESLLFVAHRREILEQSRAVFRAALQLRGFGELLDQHEKPQVGTHVFASVQSLGDGALVDPSRFDYVVLDEAHHAAARTWEALLDRLRPKELLGLTATPERSDALDYDRHFPRPWVGNLRVWNAIPHALVPFRYYFLDVEGVDLREVRWDRGRYVASELSSRLLDAAAIFVRRAIRALQEHVARPSELRALAFCVDRRHAETVAELFGREGFRAQVLVSDSPAAVRRDARAALDAGSIQILCVVDLYNEGVDVPNVDTLFFFRPTESATVFIQQLGRGLRRTSNKAELVVFDITGRQRLEFRHDRRLRALLGHTPRELRQLVEHGHGRLPSGCHISFEEEARGEILRQLRRAVPSDLFGILELLRDPAHAHLGLAEFLHETDVELEDVYAGKRSWTTLRRTAGLDAPTFADGEEDALGNLHKLLHVGDPLRLDAWERLLALEPPSAEPDRRLAAMLFGVLYGKKAPRSEATWARWASHPTLRAELAALVPVLRARNALLADSELLAPDIPLRLHATYLGSELSAAFANHTADGSLREYYKGVEPVAEGRYDLLLVTLEKDASKKEHLKYRDFPLNPLHFHWQSQASTTRDGAQGRRHLDPDAERCTPLLFVRVRAKERGVTQGFQYLGPVRPVASEGEKPITITWALRHAMPALLVERGRVAA